MIEIGLSRGIADVLFLIPRPVLAQVNLGTNSAALFLGVALIVGGAGLYFIRNFKPQLARDHDIALSAVALLAGTIMVFQGWRFDPIQMFGAYLMAGFGGFFATETLRLRGATTEQAKRSSEPMVDRDRPVSRVYRAELDELSQMDDRPVSRRIRAQRDTRSGGVDDYGSESRRRPSLRGSSERPGSSSSASRRRPSSRPDSRSSSRPDRSYWDEDVNERPSRSYWDEGTEDVSSSYSGRPGRDESDAPSRPRRPRPSDDAPRRRPDADSSDYVDFQPVDYPDDGIDSSAGYDRP